MSSDLVPLQPKVSLGRRAGAFCIDVSAVGLPSLLLGTNSIVKAILFVLLWLIMRVATVRKNQGQSLGRWLLGMRVVDTKYQRTPGVQQLCKREALLGIFTASYLVGLSASAHYNEYIGYRYVMLLMPLQFDAMLATISFNSTRFPQAWHDRLGQTIVVGTRRGYCLHLKVRKLLKKSAD
ncbi:MAG: RDD family protein [Microcoleus sp. PH2017_40_RAT_O_B]|uniref:RDD family protein n=1 Tax=unclassified Microcoleus TaxID=2642155 RepID=UPI001E120322|nr:MULTISPECIES: RDD family protein [unclassified Microcoleus]MCC3572516.1 RDD family protein [Microcoleus sp. PH2017_34_RAT_O_A]MCC3610178.1 RDD family protein [Microcoleus sp. PH2017_40_RAT_O_B]